MTTPTSPTTVTARPVVSARIGYAAGAVLLVVFVVVAVVQPHANAGASFNLADQVGTAIIGVVLALLCTIPGRPRLVADAEGVRLRQFLGGWKSVPWELVVRVEFPRGTRFARLVLPGDELIGIYAVQRLDGERAVPVMDRLRALHAAAAPTGGPGRSG